MPQSVSAEGAGSPSQVARSRSWAQPAAAARSGGSGKTYTESNHRLEDPNAPSSSRMSPPRATRSAVRQSESGRGSENEHSSRPGPIASLSSNPSEQVAAAKQRVNRLDNDYERCSAELSMISDREKEVQDGIAQLQSQLNELENHAQGLRQSLGNGQYELGNLGLKTKSLLDHIQARALERKQAGEDLQRLLEAEEDEDMLEDGDDRRG